MIDPFPTPFAPQGQLPFVSQVKCSEGASNKSSDNIHIQMINAPWAIMLRMSGFIKSMNSTFHAWPYVFDFWTFVAIGFLQLYACITNHYHDLLHKEFLLTKQLQAVREMRYREVLVARRNEEGRKSGDAQSILLHRLVRSQALMREMEQMWKSERGYFTDNELAQREREQLLEEIAMKGGCDYKTALALYRELEKALGLQKKSMTTPQEIKDQIIQNKSVEYLCFKHLTAIGDKTAKELVTYKEELIEEMKATGMCLRTHPEHVESQQFCTTMREAEGMEIISDDDLKEEQRKSVNSHDHEDDEKHRGGARPIGFRDVDAILDPIVEDESDPQNADQRRRELDVVAGDEGEDDVLTPHQDALAIVETMTRVYDKIMASPTLTALTAFCTTRLATRIDDILFIKSESEALPQHRRNQSVFAHLLKALLSNTLFFVVLSAMLTFITTTSILSLLQTATVIIFLSSFPFTPARRWRALRLYVFAVIAIKTAFQLPFENASKWLEAHACTPTHGTVSPLVLIGIIVAENRTEGQCSSFPASVWADCIFVLAISVHLIALRLAGMHDLDHEALIKRLQQYDMRTRSSLSEAPRYQEGSLQNDEGAGLHASTGEELEEISGTRSTLQPDPPFVPRSTAAVSSVWNPHVTEAISDRSDTRATIIGRRDGFYKFLKWLNGPRVQKPIWDLYTPRFLLGILCLLFPLFFWGNMVGEDTAQFASSVTKNHFSAAEVLCLVIQLNVLVVDRAVYKFQHGSITEGGRDRAEAMHRILVLLQLLGLHVAILVTMTCSPNSDTTSISSNPFISLYYIVYMSFLSCGSLQLAYGVSMSMARLSVPERTDLVSKFIFRFYQAIPFLQEFRVLTDWIVTKTSMDFFAWFKLEDAMNNLYLVKCDMQTRTYNVPRHWLKEKVLQGFCLLAALVFLILAPILFFSGLNMLAIPNPVIDGELTVDIKVVGEISNDNGDIRIGTRAMNLYTSKQADVRDDPTSNTNDELGKLFNIDQAEYLWQKVAFPYYSDAVWLVSPKLKSDFYSLLQLDKDFNITFTLRYDLTRKETAGIAARHIKESTIQYKAPAAASDKNNDDIEPLDGNTNHTIHALRQIFNETGGNQTVTIPQVFNKFVTLGPTSRVQTLQVNNRVYKDMTSEKSNDYKCNSQKMCGLRLKFTTPRPGNSTTDNPANPANPSPLPSTVAYWDQLAYWELQVDEGDTTTRQVHKRIAATQGETRNQEEKRRHGLELDIADEHVFPTQDKGTSGTFSVIGLYIGAIYTIGRFLRFLFQDSSKRVIYEEMRQPDLFMELGTGIYISRLKGDLNTETVLYQQLIKIYRSPEMLLYMTGDASSQFRVSVVDQTNRRSSHLHKTMDPKSDGEQDSEKSATSSRDR